MSRPFPTDEWILSQIYIFYIIILFFHHNQSFSFAIQNFSDLNDITVYFQSNCPYSHLQWNVTSSFNLHNFDPWILRLNGHISNDTVFYREIKRELYQLFFVSVIYYFLKAQRTHHECIFFLLNLHTVYNV